MDLWYNPDLTTAPPIFKEDDDVAKKRKAIPVPATDDAVGDSMDSLRTWAKLLVKTAGKAEARLALREYEAIASNKKVPKVDRQIAADHAKILREFL